MGRHQRIEIGGVIDRGRHIEEEVEEVEKRHGSIPLALAISMRKSHGERELEGDSQTLRQHFHDRPGLSRNERGPARGEPRKADRTVAARATRLLVAVGFALSCGPSPYGVAEMGRDARTIAERVVGACTAFRSGQRSHWDDVLAASLSRIRSLEHPERMRVYTAIAVDCSLDASYGLAYQRMIWPDRAALRDHLSRVDPQSLSREGRRRVGHAIRIATIEEPPV